MLMLTHEARLSALREELKKRGLDGFVVPISDEHMSEYIGSYAQRLAWLTGFGGSVGSAVVLEHKAAMFVDGRYTVQVRDQVDGNLYDYCQIPKESIGAWIAANAGSGARIGYDPWLHTRGWADNVSQALAKIGAELVPVDANPVDAVWEDRPAPSDAAVMVHDDSNAGQSSAEKRELVADWLKSEGLDGAVIGALDSIAWLLNIRGSDVDRTPVTLSYVLAHADGTAELFIAPEKITPEVARHLGNAVTIRPRTEFESALQHLRDKKIAVDPGSGVAAIFQTLEDAGATVVAARDPALLPKAVKNPVEQQGHRDAQARDGVAVSKFLHWLTKTAPAGGVTELDAAAKLREFREQTGMLKDLSFDTISAAGPHAALPHYRVDEDSNIPIAPGSVYLVDSGGQYVDGTTDITRTVWIEPVEPSAEVKDRYTRVLKGHIAIALAVFPENTAGSQLDAFARQFLWQAGVDYAHGTGHGVGSFLAVHEGPQRIAKSGGGQAGTDEPLQAGMFLSNEPGYYKAGEFGIRIENLVLVEPREIPGAEGTYFGFETLTFVPIDRSMVDVGLLTREEIAWWNDYHAQVGKILLPQLTAPADAEVRAWVEEGCRPL
ncbi:aminopeptidase P family protein [Allopontixanthobacter sediminis]|uniref:M24 family metallopeptidase n=1 Tax=Allopontixanthobacter sediminis TaxID=1689985 RepID=A0A845B9I6_9SPHN|nr:aminopeptidase P family protein [Allopontixanthobacter sediminis]MXP44259.1 M24 family metallopeptidase [Allopontixanthobacter sediminis]